MPPAGKQRYAILLAWPVDSLGGVAEVVRNLLFEFQAGNQVSPLAIEISGAEVLRVEESAVPSANCQPWPLIRAGEISTWNPKRPWRSILAFCVKGPRILWKLRSYCRRYAIDVLNPHFIGLEYFPLLALRKLGLFRGKLILSFHGADIRDMSRTQGVERLLCKILLRGADLLVACSGGLRTEVLQFVPECASKTVAIPNGIDAEAFASLAAEPFTLPQKFSGRPILLNVGAFEHKKGHDVLLRAFAILKGRHNDPALVIAGQGDSGAMAGLAADLGIQNDVLFLENVPHSRIAALMKRADYFVLSSRSEPFGLVLLEAGAASKPVIATETAGPAELIRNGETGLIVPIDDPPALANAISDLLRDPQKASRFAKSFHDQVVKQFTWKHTSARYEQCLADLQDANNGYNRIVG